MQSLDPTLNSDDGYSEFKSEEEMTQKEEKPKRKAGRPRKPGYNTPVDVAERNARYAREYRTRMTHEGYVCMNVWVPKEWRKELMEMVFAEVERRQALLIEPRRIPRI